MTANAAQRQIARRVMELAAPDGFVIVGGVALRELGVTTRLTEDLDAFSQRCRDVSEVARRVHVQLIEEGYFVAVDRVSDSFARMVVTTGKYRQSSLKVEFGRDTFLYEPVVGSLGPTIDIRESGANKMLAAFSRHQPRDVCDIWSLVPLVPLSDMLTDATRKDRGFDRAVLAEMVTRTIRFPDDLWPSGFDLVDVRRFAGEFVAWLVDPDLTPPVVVVSDERVNTYVRNGRAVAGYRRVRGMP